MEISNQKKKLFTMEFIVSASAIFISVATLGVSLYQSRIMQKEQEAAVWPYLEWTITTSSVQGIFLTVKNKGVGPAIIRSTELKLDGKPISSPRELINLLTLGRGDTIPSFTATIDKRVFSPGEEIVFFSMSDPSSIRDIDFGRLHERIEYKICYCSIYGECWTSRGLKVEAGECK